MLNKHRLGLDDVEPDILGRAYEYLLRKFAEGQGQSAGEFFTPRRWASHGPHPGPAARQEVYDPLRLGRPAHQVPPALLETHGRAKERASEAAALDVAPLKLYGQEINAATFAMAA